MKSMGTIYQRKKLDNETLIKYYDLINATRCLVEEKQRYLKKSSRKDETVYVAYFTINSIVRRTGLPSSEIFYQQQQFTFPIDTSMNVEIVANRKAPSTSAIKERN